MNVKQKAAKGVFWSVIQQWGSEGISFITFIILSRLLGPEAFGLVALASVFTAFVQVFVNQGFASAIVQRPKLDPEHLDTAFWVSIINGTVLTIGGIVFSGVVAAMFKEPRLEPILKWLSFGFFLSALSSIQNALLRRNLAFKSLAIRSLVATAVGGVVGISMALANFGVWSLVGQNLAYATAGVIVLWWASDWYPGFHFSKDHFKELFSFGIAIVGDQILNFLMKRMDDFLIGYYLGPTLLGYYTIGYRILLVITSVVTGIINSVAYPAFSRIQEDKNRMLRAFYSVTQYTSLLSFPVFAGIAVLAPELITVLFGSEWAPSIPVMRVLALIGILQSLLFFNDSLIKASGKPAWQLGIMFLNSVCNVIGFYIAVRWGIVAVAASFVIVSYSLAPISYTAVGKLIPINFINFFKQFKTPLLACLVMIGAILGLKYGIKIDIDNLYIQLIIFVATGALVYFSVILLTANSLFRQILDLAKQALPEIKIL